MLMSPLEWFLNQSLVPDDEVMQVLDKKRASLWRLKTGRRQPNPAEARALIALFAEFPAIVGGRRYQLDYPGCFDKCLRIEVKWND